MDGTLGSIAGVVRSGDSTVDEMHLFWGITRDAGGRWHIAVEYATNKPPLTFAAPITAADVVAHLDDAGIQRGVILSTAYWADEAEKVRAANDWVVEQVGGYPARLVAFCGVNPLLDFALGELERCAGLPQVKGMKIHFGNAGVNVNDPAHIEKLCRFFRAANDHGLAIVVHLWTLDADYGAAHTTIFLDQILPEAPDVIVQIAHAGGGGRYVYDDVLGVFADAFAARDPRVAHVYFDLATVVDPSVSDEMLAKLADRLRAIGFDRVLFGSDTTVGTRPPPLLAWVIIRRRLPVTDDELRVIAGNIAPYLR